MTFSLIWIPGLLFFLILIRVPIIFAMATVSLVYFVLNGFPIENIAVIQTNTLNTSVLTAIPMFMIAGELMNTSGATKRLLDWCSSVLSWLRGNLAYTNVLQSFVFAGMSGSALADIAGSGKIMIPEMINRGYSPKFAVGLTASTAVIGPIFPPSIPMIIYGALTGVSVGALFIGGVVPGILVAIALTIYCWFAVRKMTLTDRLGAFDAKEAIRATRTALLPLLTPILILGGIFSGVMNATEAASVAAAYAAFLGIFVYRTLSVRNTLECLIRAATTSGAILILLSVSAVLGWIITIEGIADTVVGLLADVDPILVLIGINIALLLIGMVMDSTAAMLVFVPVLTPLGAELGMDPIQFGVMIVVNLMIGLITPPVGFALFLSARLGGLRLWEASRGIWIFIAPLLVVLLMITFMPWVTVGLPAFLGMR